MENLIIIGSGPAGYTAAIYAARANLEPVLFEGEQPGGQLMTTTDVENYPGFAKGILGPEMMQIFREQAARFGTRIISKMVTKVDLKSAPLAVWAGEEKYEAKSVIVSTGASAKRLGLESEKKLYGKGVSACATCDGFFFKNKTVVVVGGGDAAMEESTFLTRFASKVYVIHRSDTLRASKIMQERATGNPKIEFIWNTEVKDIFGVEEGRVTGILLHDNKTGEEKRLDCDGLFSAIGHEPNTKIFEGQLDLVRGYIITEPGKTATNISGVFAAGDCADFRYRQAVTAAGTGCMAALEAQWYLEGSGR